MKKNRKISEGFGDERIDIPSSVLKVNLGNKTGAAANIIKNATQEGLFTDGMSKEEIINLCHQLFDEAGLDTPWTRQFFYYLSKCRDGNSALQYVYNTYLRGSKLGVIGGGRRFYEEGEECDGEKCESKKHSKKQILEAIQYWQKQLRLGNYKK